MKKLYVNVILHVLQIKANLKISNDGVENITSFTTNKTTLINVIYNYN